MFYFMSPSTIKQLTVNEVPLELSTQGRQNIVYNLSYHCSVAQKKKKSSPAPLSLVRVPK